MKIARRIIVMAWFGSKQKSLFGARYNDVQRMNAPPEVTRQFGFGQPRHSGPMLTIARPESEMQAAD